MAAKPPEAAKPPDPPDPAKEAKLAARREKYALKVWNDNPNTQWLQQEYAAAVQELQALRDGTAGRRPSVRGAAAAVRAAEAQWAKNP